MGQAGRAVPHRRQRPGNRPALHPAPDARLQAIFLGTAYEAAGIVLEKKIALPEALKWADLSIQAEERSNLAPKPIS